MPEEIRASETIINAWKKAFSWEEEKPELTFSQPKPSKVRKSNCFLNIKNAKS